MPKFSRNSLTFHRLGESYLKHVVPFFGVNSYKSQQPPKKSGS